MQLCFEKDVDKVTKQNLQQDVIFVLVLKMAQKPTQN
jgi:hypothetical protein